MVLTYALFCLGAALLQLAYVKQPDPVGLLLGTSRGVLYAPELFCKRWFQAVVTVLALASWVAEIVLGFLLVAWWAGLFFWLAALPLANVLVLGSPNPARPFFIGLPLVVAAAAAMLM